MEGCRCQVHDWSDEPQSGLRRGSGWGSRGSVWRSIIAGPVGMDHIHMLLPPTDIPAIQAWYDKNLGGLTGKRKTVATSGVTDCVYFHRFNVSFSRSDTKRDPTKGRSLDHIGFEVKNLDELVKKLEAAGTKLEAPPRMVPNSNVKIAFLTDPWGTYIELTQNLAPAAN